MYEMGLEMQSTVNINIMKRVGLRLINNHGSHFKTSNLWPQESKAARTNKSGSTRIDACVNNFSRCGVTSFAGGVIFLPMCYQLLARTAARKELTNV